MKPPGTSIRIRAVLTVLTAQAAVFSVLLAYTHYATDREYEPVFSCPIASDENFAANPRNLFEDLSRWLPADGFARGPVRNYVDFREGARIPATEATFARDGVTVTLTLFDGEPCSVHGRELRMDWEVTGPGGAMLPVSNGVAQWVSASKSGKRPVPIGEATDPRSGRRGVWIALMIFEALILTFTLWPDRRAKEDQRASAQLPIAGTGQSRCRIVRRNGTAMLAVFPAGIFGTAFGADLLVCGTVFGLLSLFAYFGASGILPLMVVFAGLATLIAGKLPDGCRRALQQVDFELQPDALVRTAMGPRGVIDQQTWPRDQIQDVRIRIATKKQNDDCLMLILAGGTEQPVYAANLEIVREVAGELRSLLGLSDDPRPAAIETG